MVPWQTPLLYGAPPLPPPRYIVYHCVTVVICLQIFMRQTCNGPEALPTRKLDRGLELHYIKGEIHLMYNSPRNQIAYNFISVKYKTSARNLDG